MKTELSESIRNTTEGRRADAILRKCVHCGFCNATCPTYQLLGDELDGPRGRIYLIKSLLEGKPVTSETRLHLDRCLTCRSCETTCPSGVEYGALLDIGRERIETVADRTMKEKLLRRLMLVVLPNRPLFSGLLSLVQWFRFVLPASLKSRIPAKQQVRQRPLREELERKVILFQGCVQPAISPETNSATATVLDRLGISTMKIEGEGCCGALHHHLADTDTSRRLMKENIDLWYDRLQSGAEAIVTTASGCGLMIKEYAEILQNDPEYRDKARMISDHCRDIGEFLNAEDRQKLHAMLDDNRQGLVYQSPCTLQHGQNQSGRTEALLRSLGLEIATPRDPHLCCGSAGSYSILQSGISEQLRQDKLEKIEEQRPDMILTANIGCQLHLQQATDVPVKHWIVLLGGNSE